MDNKFFGDYGTNFIIPGITQWVTDVCMPWIMACLQNDFNQSRYMHIYIFFPMPD